MDSGNIDTNTGVGKVITFLVAFIIVALVAVPIVNSISDGQSGSGDSGDDSGPITYTNSGDFYYKPTANDNTVHTVQYTNAWENLAENTGRYTVTLTVDGSVIYSFTVTWDDDTPPDTDSPIIQIGLDSESVFLVDFNDIGESAFLVTSGDSFTPEIKTISTGDSDSGVDECSFTVQNGVITYINYTNDETVTSEYHMDYFITTDTSGEYVLTDTPFKTDGDSMIYVCDVGSLDDSEHNQSIPVLVYGSTNTNVLTSSPVSISLEFFARGGYDAQDSTIQSAVTFTDDNGMITVSKIESEISMPLHDPSNNAYTVTDTVSLKAIVPTTVTIDPSAVEVTVTNSGQTYKELDDNSHNIHTETTTNGGITTVTVFSDDAEIMSFNRIDGDYTPKICLAFGSEGSVWLTNGNTLLMINSDGTVVNMASGSTYMDIINKTYDSHTYGTVNLEYFISNEGEYVYSDTAMASKTGQVFNIGISLRDVGELYPIFTSVQSNGTPVSALNNVQIHGYNATIVNSTAHYTDGNYVKLDGLDVTYSFTYDETDYTVDYSTNGFFVPKTFTYTESSDSGSDSDSGAGNSGMTNTIIKLIPIFLFLGLFVAFVGMFYTNRDGY